MFLSTATSVIFDVRMSEVKNVFVRLEKSDQHVAPWPWIGVTLVVAGWLAPCAKLNVSTPTPASVARTAFVPGIKVIENGKTPPFGVVLTGCAES